MEARKWLRENGYSDVADIIDAIIKQWHTNGNGTRRNWWDKLAGQRNGQPCQINGQELPVLRAAQIRQGKKVTDNSLCRNIDEVVPPKTPQPRWERRNRE